VEPDAPVNDPKVPTGRTNVSSPTRLSSAHRSQSSSRGSFRMTPVCQSAGCGGRRFPLDHREMTDRMTQTTRGSDRYDPCWGRRPCGHNDSHCTSRCATAKSARTTGRSVERRTSRGREPSSAVGRSTLPRKWRCVSCCPRSRSGCPGPRKSRAAAALFDRCRRAGCGRRPASALRSTGTNFTVPPRRTRLTASGPGRHSDSYRGVQIRFSDRVTFPKSSTNRSGSSCRSPAAGSIHGRSGIGSAAPPVGFFGVF
jgi:hypothetical protein